MTPAATAATATSGAAKSGAARTSTGYVIIKGMTCAGCALTAERLIRAQPGVRAAEVSIASERGWVRYDPLSTNLADIVRKIDALGYSARLLDDGAIAGNGAGNPAAHHLGQPYLLLQLIAALAFGMQVMMVTFAHLYPAYAAGDYDGHDVRSVQYLALLLATPVLFFGGFSFLRGAVRAARARTATMDTLVSLGTVSAYFYSLWFTLRGGGPVYFDSVVMITTFVGIGRYLETIGAERARKGIRGLLTLQPDRARVADGTGWREVEARALTLGDRILVRAGERVPADGEIAEGTASFDEAMLSGEAMPVAKAAGAPVYAGAMTLSGAALCRVTGAPGDSRLARIAALVERTLESKPPVQRLADRASAWFALAVIVIAALILVGWLATGHGASQGLMAAVAVLVVACPCALGIATPFAISTAMGRAADRGILVRNPETLEVAPRVTRIGFDKTGTLTRGRMSVVDVVAAPGGGIEPDGVLKLAAEVEQYSGHPLAAAIAAAAPVVPHGSAATFRTVPGRGVSRGEGADRVSVGTLDHVGIAPAPSLMAAAAERAAGGQTVVWVARGNRLLGFIALSDETEPTASAALSILGGEGVRSAILSGDGAGTVAALARSLGVGGAEAGLTPEAKAARVQDWQSEGAVVAMVGDGVNDAPALAAADVSVAMGAGSDIAGQTSDIILMGHDLTAIPWFFQQSQKTRSVIRQNLGWAFSYNIVMVPLAAFGLINPMVASAAMALSSLLVVGNSLR